MQQHVAGSVPWNPNASVLTSQVSQVGLSSELTYARSNVFGSDLKKRIVGVELSSLFMTVDRYPKKTDERCQEMIRTIRIMQILPFAFYFCFVTGCEHEPSALTPQYDDLNTFHKSKNKGTQGDDSGECKDDPGLASICPSLSAAGYCENTFADWMQQSCCGSCADQGNENECVDNPVFKSYCQTLVSAGLCSDSFVSGNCCASCTGDNDGDDGNDDGGQCGPGGMNTCDDDGDDGDNDVEDGDNDVEDGNNDGDDADNDVEDGNNDGDDADNDGNDGDNEDGDVGCNPDNKPTWDSPVATIMKNRCALCHGQTVRSYNNIQAWIQDGSLKSRAQKGHNISGAQQETVLDWLAIGAPQSDCDVE